VRLVNRGYDLTKKHNGQQYQYGRRAPLDPIALFGFPNQDCTSKTIYDQENVQKEL